MNHIYLIGNGFDLAHNLETSYSSFIIWYLNNTVSNIFKTRIGTEVYKYEDKLISIYIPKNYPVGMENYKPFESIEDYTFYYKNFVEPRTALHYPKITHSALLDAILDTQKWSDIELAYYDCLKKAFHENKNHVISVNHSLEVIRIKLGEYLTEKVKPRISRKIYNSAIRDLFINEGIEATSSQLFINFNYTNTFERLYFDKTNSSQQLINVHGALNNKNEPIIFGYGDNTDPFISTLNKAHVEGSGDYIKNYLYESTNALKQIINFMHSSSLFKVHVVGHSLGASDKYLISRILNDNGCKFVELHYCEVDSFDNFIRLRQNLNLHYEGAKKIEIITKPESTPFP